MDDIETQEAGTGRVILAESPNGYQTFSCERLAARLLPDQPGLEGYLCPKYVLSDRGSFFVDGAFRKTAKEQLARAHHLWQHWSDMPIGKHVAALEDDRGFRVTVQLNEEKPLGRDVMSDYRFGIPYGWSYGFDPVRDRSGTDADDAKLDRSGVPHLANIPINELRAIVESRWWEGSTVTWGAIHSAGPDVIQQRTALTRADITTLLAAFRDGTLSEEQLALAQHIVDAMASRAAAGSDHGTRDPEESVDRRGSVAAALIRHAGLSGLLEQGIAL